MGGLAFFLVLYGRAEASIFRRSRSSSLVTTTTNTSNTPTTLACGPFLGGRWPAHSPPASSPSSTQIFISQPTTSSRVPKAMIPLGSGIGPGHNQYSVLDDLVRAATLATEYKAAIKAAVLVAVPPQIAGILKWSKSTSYPSLDNPELIAPLEVAGLGSVSAHIRQLMFLDDTKATQLERSDGVWPAVEHSVAPSAATSARKAPVANPMFSTNQLLQVFDEQILPAQLQVGSRVNYWSCWRQVLTFGLAHGELDKNSPNFTVDSACDAATSQRQSKLACRNQFCSGRADTELRWQIGRAHV